MRCHLYLNKEAAALLRKLPKGARSAIVSESFLDAYRQGKLNMFLSDPKSSSKTACAGEHKSGDQKTGRHDRGSGSRKPHGPQQGQQGFKPVKKPDRGNRPASFRTEKDSSRPVKKPDGESNDKKSPPPPEWMTRIERNAEKNLEDLVRGGKK